MEGCRKFPKVWSFFIPREGGGQQEPNNHLKRHLKAWLWEVFFAPFPWNHGEWSTQKASIYYMSVILKYFLGMTHSAYSLACLQNFQRWRKYILTSRIRLLSLIHHKRTCLPDSPVYYAMMRNWTYFHEVFECVFSKPADSKKIVLSSSPTLKLNLHGGHHISSIFSQKIISHFDYTKSVIVDIDLCRRGVYSYNLGGNTSLTSR